MQLIKTIQDQCHECYACVRNCPTKAVRVRNGQAEVIQERCIDCANCVNICSQGAKQVNDYTGEVIRKLQSSARVVAGLAPSFPAFNPELSLEDWKHYLYQLGFDGVYEVAWGAQLMIEEYREYLAATEGLVISTACPVIVNYVEKYYPRLLDNLAPIVSPMGALTRYIQAVEGRETEIVLIGPCHAKKGEFSTEVLTYTELVEIGEELTGNSLDKHENMVEKDELQLSEADNSELQTRPGDSARTIPLAGGLLTAVTENEMPDGFIKVEGRDRISLLFESIIEGEISPRFVDALFCDGCISGVDLSQDNFFKKQEAVDRFIKKEEESYGVVYSRDYRDRLNLSREFTEDYQQLPQPSQEEIWSILNKTNKYSEDDLLNCGACGYDSCREKAIAVYQGLAEVEMCLPYLLTEKRSEIEEVQTLNSELDGIINASYDGMMVVNNEGKIIRVNNSYLEMLGVDREELLTKNVADLEQKRVFYPSVSLLSLKEKRNITLVQNTISGRRILVTATPLTSSNGEVERVIINARDLKELDLAVDEREKREDMGIYLEDDQLETGPGNEHIISYSREMKNILQLSSRIADTDSTVLITGESGVGKEVIARYIHEQSPEREDFVKINCAAIPERLLESELFGYETGAFSGARREGKQGLIEKADNGTLFLDEIGEMPIKMQAKLLQVIQEHRVTRIGGVEAINVDFRLITATNRDLKQMVANKEFREDLFYRLNVVPINIPPLRERKEDILPLVRYFAGQLNQKYDKDIKFSQEAEQLLLEYEWPGNVREVSNLLERIIVTAEGREVDCQFLRQFLDFENEEYGGVVVNEVLPLKEAVARVEKELLSMVREKDMTTYEMANLLGVNQSTVVRKLNRYFD